MRTSERTSIEDPRSPATDDEDSSPSRVEFNSNHDLRALAGIESSPWGPISSAISSSHPLEAVTRKGTGADSAAAEAVRELWEQMQRIQEKSSSREIALATQIKDMEASSMAQMNQIQQQMQQQTQMMKQQIQLIQALRESTFIRAEG